MPIDLFSLNSLPETLFILMKCGRVTSHLLLIMVSLLSNRSYKPSYQDKKRFRYSYC